MIEKILIISLLVLSIHYTYQPGEIFARLGSWFERNLPYQIHQPVFDCNICMCPWYGSVIYWAVWGLWLHTGTWQEWVIVIIGAMGINIIINKWAPDKDDRDPK
jgi:hypothetical protein